MGGQETYMERGREGRGAAEAPVGGLKAASPPPAEMEKPERTTPSASTVVAGSPSSNEEARGRGPSAVPAEKLGKIDSRSGTGGSSSSSSNNTAEGSTLRGGACQGKRRCGASAGRGGWRWVSCLRDCRHFQTDSLAGWLFSFLLAWDAALRSVWCAKTR